MAGKDIARGIGAGLGVAGQGLAQWGAQRQQLEANKELLASRRAENLEKQKLQAEKLAMQKIDTSLSMVIERNTPQCKCEISRAIVFDEAHPHS